MIPLTITSVVGSVLLASSLAGWFGFMRGMDHEQDKQARIALSQSESNRELERIANKANGKVDRDYQSKLAAVGATAAATRVQRDRLFAAIAALPPIPEPAASACGPFGERDGSLKRLLAEGAGLLEEGGERVGALAAKLAALQARESEVNKLLVAP